MSGINIAIFASGSGTNAENLINFLNDNFFDLNISPKLVLSNRSDAYVLERAARLNVKSSIFSAKELREERIVDDLLISNSIDFIVLAGFLLKLPDRLVSAYNGRIINVHPSLLPKYGGKGMYGEFVHRAVIESGDNESGITVHLVDEIYDNGEHLFQAKCTIESGETPDSLAKKIHALEKEHLPTIICNYIINYGK
ncbi:MAG: phosphoribosylglycinamide formyltransferase [Bacteroidales bacterium]|nr:phosphoribosylglycinamide formyltransferase [Bacteroidales bacterium]